ncbi:OmpA family protein [Cognatiyoonia sp. IB215182]|uniref:OmpA family protein n=1 Tax=Cognatiyoonia sp. IB215182 TaxID=3097353 RepID=UPI002A0CFEE9|nr:OmpA family protein [Cognatiyoonia sp. IB215182]MDX8352695.1 OmpA family protein [Cognatiyoonia sp. IB215182]
MKKLHFVTALMIGAMSLPAAAQDIDESEILSLFEAQRSAFTELREGGQLRTRGLTLVTVDDVEPSGLEEVETPESPSVGAELAPLQPTTDTTVAQTAPTAPVAPTTDSVMFGRLDPNLQVNLFVKFDFDSAAIADDQKPTLDRMCVVMRDSDINVFQIVGHTDTAGSDSYNERLSRLRAEEVARYLVGSCDIAADRLTTLGMGERFPINASDTRADENRRVEFQALS